MDLFNKVVHDTRPFRNEELKSQGKLIFMRSLVKEVDSCGEAGLDKRVIPIGNKLGVGKARPVCPDPFWFLYVMVLSHTFGAETLWNYDLITCFQESGLYGFMTCFDGEDSSLHDTPGIEEFLTNLRR